MLQHLVLSRFAISRWLGSTARGLTHQDNTVDANMAAQA